MANTNRLVLPLLSAAQAQKHVTVNEALKLLDAIVQAGVIDKDLTTPPSSPNDGDIYIVASGGTGDWLGHDDDIAVFQDGGWVFITPRTGWVVWVDDESALNIYSSGGWGALTLASGGAVGMLGINGATPDSTNRLAMNSPGALLNHDGGNMAVTVNKAAAGDDGGFYFQTGFSTRAVFGLMGSDDWSVRVSPDGSTFHSAINIDRNTGHIGLGAAGDANNRLVVSGESSLFTNSGDLRFTFSKGSAGDDAALTFQTNFSSRALIGLLGSDDFQFTVSPDGNTYTQAIVIDKDTAAVDLPQHPKFSAYLNFGQNYTAGAWRIMQFNNTRHNDQLAFASNTFTAPHDGYYMFGAGATFETPGTIPTKMQIGFSVNGADPTPDTIGTTGDATITTLETHVNTTALLKLSAGDTVNAVIFFTTNDGRVLADENYFWGYQVP